MHPIIYDVAVSVDGFISGPDGDVSGFAHDGPVVEDYAARMAEYSTAIMGRATYEFGYQFGLEPGQNPYPHMQTIVFSDSLTLPADSQVQAAGTATQQQISDLRQNSPGPIYLCGGGAFAGALLEMGQITTLRLKRAPIFWGAGVKLFGDSPAAPALTHLQTRTYDNGYLFQEYAVAAAEPRV